MPWPHSSARPHARTAPATSAAEKWVPPPSQEAPETRGSGRSVFTAMLAKPSPTWPSPLRPQPCAGPSASVTKLHSAPAKTPVTAAPRPPRESSWGKSRSCFSALGTSRSGSSRIRARAPLPRACSTCAGDMAAALLSAPEASRMRMMRRPSTSAPPPSWARTGAEGLLAAGSSSTRSPSPQPAPLSSPSCPVELEPQAKTLPAAEAARASVWLAPLAICAQPSSTTAGSALLSSTGPCFRFRAMPMCPLESL
mmetsp:Transcript_84886/g.274923  ORF Transcript_84886/g.274923 Transcript_84886/m.274923 type:complete len:253 (+) Transcript_84886:298-1056(+)